MQRILSNLAVCAAGMLLLGLASGGCSKKAAPAGAPEVAAPQPAAQVAETAQSEADVAYLRDLQLSVDAYEKIYKRKPATLEQMVREGFIAKLPPAPPGRHFTLDPATAHVGLAP
jgi:hypothetical protein